MKKIAIIGGGPSGLFVFKRLMEAKDKDISIDIYEKKKELGPGMPYSSEGASEEHITNVSGNEIPDMEISLTEWIKNLNPETLKRFDIDAEKFSGYKVLPRLLFGQYLKDQFRSLERKSKENGISVNLHRGTLVTDIIDDKEQNVVKVVMADDPTQEFDYIIICTGHHWPRLHEGRVNGYFDSPYPPSKLAMKINHPVGIRGSSLTAVDAVRTRAS